MTVELTEEAHRVLGEVALRWGGVSRVAAVELMLRRIGHLPPFEREDGKPWFGPLPEMPVKTTGEEFSPEKRREVLLAMLDSDGEEDPEPEANAEPETVLEEPGPAAAVVPEVEVEPDQEPDAEANAEPAPAAEEPAREPREFVRAWYDDDAPTWVQLLGADATNGLDLTAEQREALNDWQAGIDREAP